MAKPADTGRCQVCRTPFTYRTTKAPTTCGLLACMASAHWREPQWRGLARMARARQSAGQPLTDLDHEALRRDTA